MTKSNTSKDVKSILVRKFEPADNQRVQLIFYEGLMEMVPDTAFRVICFIITMCWWVIGLLPAIVLCGRYFCSRHVINGYLEHAMRTDMGDIEGFYMKSPDSCMWVAVVEGKVVGIVAADGQHKSGDAVELRRMSVDQRYRWCGVGKALGRKVLEFAVAQRYSSVILGTTAYSVSAHLLYQRLGFRCVWVTNGYVTPGARASFLERIFYRVRHHHYRLDVQNSRITSNGQHSLL
uniref:N-acetylaspartate synthetase-like isoform X2 n=1 Tax=Scatophagus argus TaxID=75038 RepID=UPI001ED7E719|nr:N-acetylaspartate synthetase-like isoform X2 [Scatophagus argus]